MYRPAGESRWREVRLLSKSVCAISGAKLYSIQLPGKTAGSKLDPIVVTKTTLKPLQPKTNMDAFRTRLADDTNVKFKEQHITWL